MFRPEIPHLVAHITFYLIIISPIPFTRDSNFKRSYVHPPKPSFRRSGGKGRLFFARAVLLTKSIPNPYPIRTYFGFGNGAVASHQNFPPQTPMRARNSDKDNDPPAASKTSLKPQAVINLSHARQTTALPHLFNFLFNSTTGATSHRAAVANAHAGKPVTLTSIFGAAQL